MRDKPRSVHCRAYGDSRGSQLAQADAVSWLRRSSACHDYRVRRLIPRLRIGLRRYASHEGRKKTRTSSAY